MPVDTQHPDYIARRLDYEQIAHNKAGERVVKAKGQRYLPKPEASDESDENDARYAAYLLRAVFHNVVGRTVENLVGQCFSVAPVATVPDEMKFLIDDIDAAGNSAEQQSKLALDMVVSQSRAGLWVDYPPTGGVVSLADKEARDIRSRVILVDPINIINWRVSLVGSQSKLSLIVIKERYIRSDDGFEAVYDDQYRVLKLVNSVYRQELWRKTDSAWVVYQSNTPTKDDGTTWDEIPFTCIGAKSNDIEVEKPLMLDISCLNFAHYRNSADYEEAVFMVGQPTPVYSGLNEKWVSDVMKGKAYLGSRGGIMLPKDGKAELLQAAPTTMAKDAMDQKELLMQALGARLVDKRQVKATATEAGIDESSETSVLASCVHNVTDAYGKVLRWAALYEGFTVTDPLKDILYELNDDFAVARMNPLERAANRDDFAAGLILLEEARDNLLSGGVAYVEDIQEFKDLMDAQHAAEMQNAQTNLNMQTAAQLAVVQAKSGVPSTPPPVPAQKTKLFGK